MLLEPLAEEQTDKMDSKPLEEQTEANPDIVDAITTDIIAPQDKRAKKAVVNKRIDFTRKTYTKIEMMMPIYRNEIESNNEIGQAEVLSYVIEKAVSKLFDEDFKKKLEEL